jgi:hypothetical protein
MKSPSLFLRLIFVVLIACLSNACSKDPLPAKLTAKISGYNYTD